MTEEDEGLIDLTRDNIIRTRLSNDNKLLKNCWTTFNTLISASDSSARSNALEQMLIDLEQFDILIKKFQMVHEMNMQESVEYENDLETLETELKSNQTRLEKLKVDLENEKKIVLMKKEYDLIAEEINKLPSRSETLEKISQLNSDIEQLKEQQISFTESLEKRRSIVSRMVYSMHEIQQEIINEPEQNADVMDVDEDSIVEAAEK